MIEEAYVNFETAKLLKEKGFNCSTYRAYCETNRGHQLSYDVGRTNSQWDKFNKENGIFNCSAPTQQMAMRWLREVHHYYIQVMLDSWACGIHMGYYVVIQKTDSDFEIMLSDYVDNIFYQTYEEACETAIKYCLENLI